MARKKNQDSAASKRGKSDAPAKTRWYKQLWQVYQMTRRYDPLITLWMALMFLAVLALCVGVGSYVAPLPLWYTSLFGIALGLLPPLILLMRRAQRAAYAQIEGQPGATGSALQQVRAGWIAEEEPIAIDPRTQDLVFRAVGKAGIVLVGEGPKGRIEKMLETEKRRLTRILPDVPVTLLQCGNDEGQIPLRKLSTKVTRMNGPLRKPQIAEVSRRLKAIGGMRLPIPKGVDPMRMRPDRKGLKGR